MSKSKSLLLRVSSVFFMFFIMSIMLTLSSSEALAIHEKLVSSFQDFPTPTPSISNLSTRIFMLESRLDGTKSLVETQSNVFNAAVSRMESNIDLLLAIFAVASLFAAILGLSVVRLWVRSLVESRVKDLTSQEISRLSQEEIERIRKEWDPKFAKLYDEYRESMRKR